MDGAADAPTSASLLARLRHAPADQDAWRQFVQRYGGQIYSWCRHWNLQQADAEDVTQAVLLKLADKMRTFRYDPDRSFRGWLRTLAHHAWRDFLDGRRQPGGGSGDTGVLQWLETVEARDDLLRQLEEEFDRELLEEAMGRVRLRVQPHTWEAFRLLAVEGVSGAEAAARLGMKVATVFVAKSKVHRMLQEEVRRLDPPTLDEAEGRR
jgi:RNA polymerase sigma factor (sigma-70 family)